MTHLTPAAASAWSSARAGEPQSEQTAPTRPTPDIARIRELAEAATPGPYSLHKHSATAVFAGERLVAGAGSYNDTRNPNVYEENEANAAYFADLDPATVIALCELAALADRLAEGLKRANEALAVRGLSSPGASALLSEHAAAREGRK